MNTRQPIEYTPIGVIHTPFQHPEGMPIQPSGAAGVRGSVDLDPRYADGLKDLDGFSHLILIYHCHRSEGYDLVVTPFLDQQAHGVFATRAPRRPNPIGLSTVRLLEIRENRLHIENVDMLDGTPLLDIKPAVPEFEPGAPWKLGWLEQSVTEARTRKSDSRFSSEKSDG